MERYENLGFAFKEMLKRTKMMRMRLKYLKTMNKNTSELPIKNEQYQEMQLECDGINASLEYLKVDIKRTIIMLKICLYKEKSGKKISVKETNTISSVNETNRSEEKTKTIPRRRDEYGDSGKRTDLEQRRIYTSSLQCSPSSKLREKSVNFENILIKKFRKFKGEILIIRLGNGREKREKNLFLGEGDGLEENLMTAINTLFLFLRILPEWEKIKCKIKNSNFNLHPTNQ